MRGTISDWQGFLGCEECFARELYAMIPKIDGYLGRINLALAIFNPFSRFFFDDGMVGMTQTGFPRSIEIKRAGEERA